MTINLDLTDVESTYKQNNYGDLFYSTARVLKPRLVVEFGTYQGYSGMHLAAGLRDNAEIRSELHLVDLWDNYQYRHCSIDATIGNFKRNGLLEMPNVRVRFDECRAEFATFICPDGSIDLLHVDISNCGHTLQAIFEAWEGKLSPGATVIIEGGSVERDAYDWMVKFNRQKIRPWLQSDWVNERFDWVTFDPFPSVTVMRRK